MLKNIKINIKNNKININKLYSFYYIFKDFYINQPNNNYNFLKKFKIYYQNTFIYFFLHLIWKGKAYRVRFFKKSQKFTFNFGHSHWTKLYYDNSTTFFKLKRQLYLILFYNLKDKEGIVKTINSIRFFNKYTLRGLKIKQTPYRRRFGKISQANSLLHAIG